MEDPPSGDGSYDESDSYFSADANDPQLGICGRVQLRHEMTVRSQGNDVSWHLLCELAELSQDVGREFVVCGRVIAVFRNGQDIHAIDGMCAHQGGPIAQGKLDAKCVTCPWHGWQYDISNGKNLLTGKKMLDCFVVETRGDEVWVQIV